MIKAVVFDFDGVFVMDSDAVFKKEAWNLVWESQKKKHEPFFSQAKNLYGNGKAGGREDIIRFVYKKMGFSCRQVDDLTQESLKVFDDYVQSKIKISGTVSGTTGLLNNLSKKGLLLFINSGTSIRPLKVSVENLGLSEFFKKIYGSSNSKSNNLRKIIKNYHLTPSELLVVGDGDSDYESAKEAGANFVGVCNRWNNWQEKNSRFLAVSNLEEIIHYV